MNTVKFYIELYCCKHCDIVDTDTTQMQVCTLVKAHPDDVKQQLPMSTKLLDRRIILSDFKTLSNKNYNNKSLVCRSL